MENWSVNTDFRRNEGFQGETANSIATIVNYFYFSKIKTTQVSKRKSSQKKNYSKKYSLPKKTNQVIYSSKSISLLYTTGHKLHCP